ncbi:hypothetical protein HK405_011302 [Cladochytrium tenue]|nr:hypothetical protein HK405_011302 [Cladochytrium tenue]
MLTCVPDPAPTSTAASAGAAATSTSSSSPSVAAATGAKHPPLTPRQRADLTSIFAPAAATTPEVTPSRFIRKLSLGAAAAAAADGGKAAAVVVDDDEPDAPSAPLVDEPILAPNNGRFVLFPIHYPEVRAAELGCGFLFL